MLVSAPQSMANQTRAAQFLVDHINLARLSFGLIL